MLLNFLLQVGDPLAIRFEILDIDTPYDMFVRELVAMDGMDNSQVLLVDTLGCPTDATIIQTLFTVRESPKTLQANFDAFKFAGSSIVQFRAMVTPCIPKCDPIICNDFSPRVRRSINQRNLTESDDDSTVVVANKLTIVDKPENLVEEEIETKSCVYRTEYMMTVYTVCVVFSVLLVCQCVVIVLCVKLRKTHIDNNDL